MILYTRPFLPPKKEYERYLDGIWHRQWLTNSGPLASELEMRLKDYLSIDHLLFVTSGTIALQMAIKVLNLTGEIITTPFSFVATTSSIFWESCKPVFVDIDEATLNIDATKIEKAITEKTSAIVATHVYGNPCDVVAIEKIAHKHNLHVIYDGAHAFGVKVDGRSVFEYGDISICSLHATKLYHTVEGGLLITRNRDILRQLADMRNFGFSGVDAFACLGINGKNSEFHAAMGLANLPYIDSIIKKRKVLVERYRRELKTLKAVEPIWHANASHNYAYFPLVFEHEKLLLKCNALLAESEIFARRYFYPPLSSSLPYLTKRVMPITDQVAKRALCLPLWHDLSVEEVDMISRLLLRAQNN
ncbi:DegT/DnrJ/EryC1/StrS family aminotransferase [Parapedobacter sp. DT-150]|uniref:DegT/DnrJ/EryC1/StrS family aminotransferase n=1 Tax=Parapedobacter sp. DT-150 TaxID=3396162 RepID=UPI003F1C8359